MYHHQSQQQGPRQFSNGPRPHRQHPQNQQQNLPSTDMLSGFQFPRPTQLPDELESALAIRGARDMDHRLIDHINRPNQHHNQGSGYGPNPITLASDNQGGQQQGVDWSSYQPPPNLFASPPPSASHHSQQHQGTQQQAQSSNSGTSIPSWVAPASDSLSPQSRHPHSGGVDGQSLYTPESAGSILASFGLSNEDLEVLSHYPDEQLTPDTLPFILRDIQINKSDNQQTVASTSSSSFSRSIHNMLLPQSCSSPLGRSCSPEVPSLLAVTQTAGKVIDYGHASRAKEESNTRETFKREPLSGERTVKMYPSSSSVSAPKVDKSERRQVRLEHIESSKHGDRDYRRTSSDPHKSNRSPGREIPSSKSRNLDRDYRHDGTKPRTSSETRSDASSRRSLSSSSGTKPHSSSKKLPTPTMISDFSAVSPKVYPHTCSLCHIQCDHEKDWVDHINTVNHTAACRDLRNKYPEWKQNLPSRSDRYGHRQEKHPSSYSVSPSFSSSSTPSPPHSKHRSGPRAYRSHGAPYSPHQPRHHHTTESSSKSVSKRQHYDSSKRCCEPGWRQPSSKTGGSSKHGPSHSSTKTVKSWTKPGAKSSKPPPAKKKKKVITPASQDSIAERLVYLTGIPTHASEQEVTDLVGSFGKINNVILMPCSDKDSEKREGQKASVCMMKAEHAQALAGSTHLFIGDQKITALTAKQPDAEQIPNNSKPATAPGTVTGEQSGGEGNLKTSDEKAVVLITGLPESGWSESDIIKLVQPFGTPSDIILATSIGKVLVSMPDMETAQEMVKVQTFIPVKIQDSELKMIPLKQNIGINTPVSLYNLLTASLDPLESPAPVAWSCLLVISNVPDSLSGSSEAQKLVRRFGTVIKTLVVNNMIVCEMATAAMALSVYKRFQKFPCIIQNNPLFFSRRPDPKANTQAKVISAYLDISEDPPANGKGNKTAPVDEEEGAHEENSKEKDSDEKLKSTEKKVCEDGALGGNGGKDDKIKKDQPPNLVSDSSVAPEVDVKSDMRKTSAVENVSQTTDEAPEAENDETPAGEETPGEPAIPETPKVTQDIVNALLVECRTRTASCPNKTEASTDGTEAETELETERDERAAEETKEQAKSHTEEELKKHEIEKKERKARMDAREKERKERRAWENEQRARRDRERDERARKERERREWERKERERRERKRPYGEGSFEPRSSYRSEAHKQSSWKEERYNNSAKSTKMDEDKEADEFPFSLSDFVTVDEVGDVTDLPQSSAEPMETTEGGDGALTSDQQDTAGDTPTEFTTVLTLSETTATSEETDEHVSKCEAVIAPTDSFMSSELTDGLVLVAASLPSPSPQVASLCTPTWQPGAPETVTVDSIPGVETPPAPAASCDPLEKAPEDSSSDTPNTEVVTAERQVDDEEQRAFNPSHEKDEEIVSDKAVEQETMQSAEDKGSRIPSAEAGMQTRCESDTTTEQKNVKKTVDAGPPTASQDYSLTPFDPGHPVGLEFLVPKTGFFCKVCNRFYSGGKEVKLSHCKSLNHYENLQKYLEMRKVVNVPAKPNSS